MKKVFNISPLVYIKFVSVFLNLTNLLIIGMFWNDYLALYVSTLAASIILSALLDAGENNLNLNRSLKPNVWYTNYYFSFPVRLVTFIFILSFLFIIFHKNEEFFKSGYAILFGGLSNLIFMRIKTIYWRSDDPYKSYFLGEFCPSLLRFVFVPSLLLLGYSFNISFALVFLIAFYISRKIFIDGVFDILPFKLNLRDIDSQDMLVRTNFFLTYFTSVVLALKDQIVSLYIPELPSSNQSVMVIYTRILTILNILITPKNAKINSCVTGSNSDSKKALKQAINLFLIILIMIISISLLLENILYYLPSFNLKWNFYDGLIVGLSLLVVPFITYFMAKGFVFFVLVLSIIVSLVNILWWS